MIARCGMDCSQCEAYKATRDDSDARRKEVAEAWTIEYKTDISPEQINCRGCTSEGEKFFFTESLCEIRKCAMEKEAPHCATCPDYICEKLKGFIAQAPVVGEALEALRQKQGGGR
ncbi:DUF3795 domain-containing protein [Desulfoluna butyratoxydans]|uniref:DUF3795 domain-containing protein n=1 Tax=Desulfoluna butyratoxydans TaxID=231438 RepID=A0A4U8YTD5_9BACT|nr:DUF3795 domain-containing protein [Desulfoluna butyratoxydans]VFQ46817.1 protein of unknown function duf3795 [Desulfoluna butyratoxydans]